MIPSYVVSTLRSPEEFRGSRNEETSPTQDYEDGPIYLQDTSEGMEYQKWGCFASDVAIWLFSQTTSLTQILSIGGASFVAFTFDQNANPTIAYRLNAVTYLYWYDSTAEAMVTTSYGTDVLYPKLSLDDKRAFNISNSDVIFAYIENENLYFRAQSDRFETPYLLASVGALKLRKIGMTKGLRFQFWLSQYV